MAHFAKLDENNVVIQVNVVNNNDIQNLPFPESEQIGIQFLANWSGGYTNWKQTSYNGSFRKKYSSIGDTYRHDIDAFVSPQPFPSWSLNEQTGLWESPVQYPLDIPLLGYRWDEDNQQWVGVQHGS
jgi:hypothetical protein